MVDESLFSISCTTCQAKLKVLSESAIGQIHFCPKCESMVLIVPPPGWKAPPAKAAAVRSVPQPADGTRCVPAADSPADPGKNAGPSSPPPLPSPAAAEAEDWALSPVGGAPAAGAGWQWVLAAVLSATTVAALVVAWSVFTAKRPASAVGGQIAVAQPSATPKTAFPDVEAKTPESPPAKLNRRWIPAQTKVLISVRLAALAGREESKRIAAVAEPFWRPSAGRVLEAFGMRPETVARITWASTDAADPGEHSVALIELDAHQDARTLSAAGGAVALRLEGVACRRMSTGVWRQPFAVLDPRTIVTGREDLLRELADRTNGHVNSIALERFLKAATAEADLIGVCDMAAARQAGWLRPVSTLDVWPAGRKDWHTVWEAPQAIGAVFRRSPAVQCELALVCDSQTTAQQVKAAVTELIPGAKKTLDAQAESIAKELQAGRVPVQVADHLAALLKQGESALDATRAEVADESVWVRFGLDRISEDAAPEMLEKLAALAGRKDATVAAADPRSPLPARSDAPQADRPAAVSNPAGTVGKPSGNPKADEVAALLRELTHAAASSEGPGAKKAKLQADVSARLEDRIVGFEWSEKPLGAGVDQLAAILGSPVTFDMDALEQLGVSLGDPVSVSLRQTSPGGILEAMLARRGLIYMVADGMVLVTSPEGRRIQPRAVRYTVSDLAGTEKAGLEDLARRLRKLVVPESWQEAGGRGTIEITDGAWRVVQTDAVHYRVLIFCEKLRVARGRPLRSRYPAALFSLATRADRARAKLGEPVTLNFHEPAPLGEIVGELAEQTKSKIVVDWRALAAEAIPPQVEGTLQVDRRPLAEALDKLLRPLGLAVRAVDATTLEVTTVKALAARLELEIYPVAGLLSPGVTAAALRQRIKAEAAASSWSDAGGPGVIDIDPPSNCLLVLQSPAVQAQVEALLARIGAEKAEPPKPAGRSGAAR
jgi:hypothetical protein